jgi:hypothetical protein
MLDMVFSLLTFHASCAVGKYLEVGPSGRKVCFFVSHWYCVYESLLGLQGRYSMEVSLFVISPVSLALISRSFPIECVAYADARCARRATA